MDSSVLKQVGPAFPCYAGPFTALPRADARVDEEGGEGADMSRAARALQKDHESDYSLCALLDCN